MTIGGNVIPITKEAKLLGTEISYRNFYVKQVAALKKKARGALWKSYRFRYLKEKLKLRLFKVLILPLLTYPVIPLNILSNEQMEHLQVVQNDGIRWIKNERWPIRCPLDIRHEELKLEYIRDRIKRLAEGQWDKIVTENTEFWRETMAIPTPQPHAWFPSAYNASFD